MSFAFSEKLSEDVDVNNFYEDTEGDIVICSVKEKKDEENVEDVEMEEVLEDHGETTEDSSTHYEEEETQSTILDDDEIGDDGDTTITYEEEETQSTILDDDDEIGDDGETTITETTVNELDRIREGLPERAVVTSSIVLCPPQYSVLHDFEDYINKNFVDLNYIVQNNEHYKELRVHFNEFDKNRNK
ncbi:uncharacterized protein LOC131806639 [Musca domestica]|uniref:Uncharacterized protein LOC131803859 n=1 Tax=Musca domestica TaxID=7370 RepID=A0ABM3VMT7_MUSDO|nr:uncharacterized protein LOC131803859 [Musca domestica]XP_058981639.1 uncharacterized protein LOC131803863 [Musca domestica]XP_058987114.1 uncharacterized protein LOC131806639 [Musca domestica]